MGLQAPLGQNTHTHMLTVIYIHIHIPSNYTHIHSHTSQTFSRVCNTKTHANSYSDRHAHPDIHTLTHSSNTLVHTYTPL